MLQGDGTMLTMEIDEESAINLSTSTAVTNGTPDDLVPIADPTFTKLPPVSISYYYFHFFVNFP